MGLAHLQNRVSALIDGPLRGKFLPPAIAQAFSLRPHERMEWTPPHGGPLQSTHTIWLHFTYDSNDDADLLKAFTLPHGRILPHADILAMINEQHPLVKSDARRKPFPPSTFSQSWLNKEMGMAAAPSHIFRVPFVVSATPVKEADAASDRLRFSTVLGGTALCAPPLPSRLDFGIPPPERWLKRSQGTDEGRAHTLKRREARGQEAASSRNPRRVLVVWSGPGGDC